MPSQSFQRALEEASRARRSLDAGDDAEQKASAPNVRVELGLPSAAAGAGKARWEEAMTWAIEAAPATVPAIASSAPASPVATLHVSDELGLGADLTDTERKRLWRAFVWRHHPDRQPPGARRDANARVAMANALYDRARRDAAQSLDVMIAD